MEATNCFECDESVLVDEWEGHECHENDFSEPWMEPDPYDYCEEGDE